MSHALPLAPIRRGACPTLDAPMPTGDGLLARIRLERGQLDPVRLEQLALLCGRFGNGTIEITARGNLQVRGLTAAAVPDFASAVREIITVETGLVVETPPLAGDDPLEFVDPRPLAAAIRMLAAPFAHRLGPKVAVIVDGNGQIGLKALKADLRFVAVGADTWLVSVGATLLGTTRHPQDCAGIVLMTLASLGSLARATDLVLPDLLSELADLVSPSAPVQQPVTTPIGDFVLRGGRATGIGLPFGAMAWQDIAALADDAWQYGVTAFRPGPHHSLIAIGADDGLVAATSALGFVSDPHDNRTRISACIGSAGCASGHMAARAVASRLAPGLAPGSSLHVSGCAKGCAHPGRADVTLVGRSDGYGLVIDGRAGDTPRAVLRADQLDTALLAAQG